MIKLDLQFFGGRGSGSASGGGGGGNLVFGGPANQLGLAGQTYFEGNKVSVSGTVDYWENKSRDLDHEELLMIGEDGFAAGYFKGERGSVGFNIPNGVDPKKTVLTHNHPVKQKDGRTISGSFSDADLTNHIKLGFKETRAVGVEGSYSFKTTSKSNPTGFQKALGTRKSTVSKAADKRYTQPGNTKSYIDIYLEESHKWYSKNAGKYGYDYSFTPKK